MLMIGKKCDCPCHETKAMHFVACCFKCPCCGENIGFMERYGHEERSQFIEDHLICCTSAHPEPIKYGEPTPLDRYLKQFGLLKEEQRNNGALNRMNFIKENKDGAK